MKLRLRSCEHCGGDLSDVDDGEGFACLQCGRHLDPTLIKRGFSGLPNEFHLSDSARALANPGGRRRTAPRVVATEGGAHYQDV